LTKSNPKTLRRYVWSAEKYRDIVRGNRKQGVEGLRSLVRGFDSRDGYNLQKFEDWTTYQRAKVRDYFHRLEVLQGQPKRMIRVKDKKKLRKLQESFHGGIPSEKFKVAFIPDTEPRFTLPGGKKRPPRVRILKEGVSLQRKQYERIFIPFDQKRLVKAPRKEIKRASDQMKKAQLFFVQVGEYQSLVGKSLGLMVEQILDWMQKYDGKKDLPNSSGNRGDDPKHHHWKYWLNGLVGYVMPKVDRFKVARLIYEGRQQNARMVRLRRNYMKRKGQ